VWGLGLMGEAIKDEPQLLVCRPRVLDDVRAWVECREERMLVLPRHDPLDQLHRSAGKTTYSKDGLVSPSSNA
jgi:hypothetical protein